MPESDHKSRRFGYRGSGFVYYFIRFADTEALDKYLAEAGYPATEGSPERTGFCIGNQDNSFPPVCPESCRGSLLAVRVMAVANTDRRAEMRRWRHEISHAVFFSEGQYLHLSQPDAVYTSRLDEFRACLSEYLNDAVDQFLREEDGGEPGGAISSLVDMMPWAQETTA